jgi:hypothetical protein
MTVKIEIVIDDADSCRGCYYLMVPGKDSTDSCNYCALLPIMNKWETEQRINNVYPNFTCPLLELVSFLSPRIANGS